jgi:hypothetical protein
MVVEVGLETKGPFKDLNFSLACIKEQGFDLGSNAKRNMYGFGICMLCKMESKTITHVVVKYSYVQQLHRETNKLFTSISNVWNGESLKESLRPWFDKKELKECISLSCLISWGI